MNVCVKHFLSRALRVAAVGFLPFTPILIGRLIDAARGDRVHDVERLFWAWSVAITVFFSPSRFKLDHYIYPVPPGLSLIVAHTWWRLRTASAWHSSSTSSARSASTTSS